MGKCLGTPIEIRDDREVVQCDELEFPFEWKEADGYFLVRIQEGQICVGYVDENHELNLEFRGTDPAKLTKEIVRRDFLSKDHTAYIAGEIILAHRCVVDGTEYIQR